MFARRVSLQLKPETTKQLTETMEREVLPVLRKCSGFQDEMTFVSQDGTRAFGISFWDGKESADAYARDHYPAIEKLLEPLVQGKPQIGTYSIANSTMHKIAAGVTA